ncbi:MAG: hypothetical protein JSR46_09825 [Verrucomicrobia bacterium]|nr:hypothetical protein [Verrucomicrobiota bacterium]
MAEKKKTTKYNKTERSKEFALPILATCPNYCEAARQIGVSKEQIYEWMKDPEFKTQVDKMRSELVGRTVEEATCKLKSAMTKAVDTLVVLLDREDYPAVQRAAANDILGHIQKFKELHEFEERLSRLEQRHVA